MGGLSLNPFTGFGLLDTGLEYVGNKNLQNDAQEHSAEMFLKQSQHDKDMFGLESQFVTNTAQDQYHRQRMLLQGSPGLQMQGLKSAGLNPILAATGGFKSPAGGAMPIPHASAKSSAKGDSTSSPSLSRAALAQANLLNAQAALTSAQKAKVQKETQFVGTKTDIAEPVAKLMQAIAGMLEASNIDRNTTQNVWRWLTSELPDVTKPLTKQQQVEMLEKAKRRFPQLKGVDNAKRKIFGGQ